MFTFQETFSHTWVQHNHCGNACDRYSSGARGETAYGTAVKTCQDDVESKKTAAVSSGFDSAWPRKHRSRCDKKHTLTTTVRVLNYKRWRRPLTHSQGRTHPSPNPTVEKRNGKSSEEFSQHYEITNYSFQ